MNRCQRRAASRGLFPPKPHIDTLEPTLRKVMNAIVELCVEQVPPELRAAYGNADDDRFIKITKDLISRGYLRVVEDNGHYMLEPAPVGWAMYEEFLSGAGHA